MVIIMDSKRILILLIAIACVVNACAGKTPANTMHTTQGKVVTVDCMEPRPEACTKEYLPVCGQRSDATRATYGNKCEACADAAVLSYFAQACPTDDGAAGTVPRLAYTQCVEPRPGTCTTENQPVCADCENCATPQTFGNACVACANASVTGYWPYSCEDQPVV
jgi:hypothetical protein